MDISVLEFREAVYVIRSPGLWMSGWTDLYARAYSEGHLRLRNGTFYSVSGITVPWPGEPVKESI
jgi:hypothetical protein